MIDLHVHTIFSDGELIPFELVRRAEVNGYTTVALTDHLDASNMETVIPRLVEAAAVLNRYARCRVLPGCELTHIPPGWFDEAVRKARALGARVVVAHGETPVEPVAPGTNIAAIEAGVDILAHPGFITADEVRRAVAKGVMLEVTARGGHNITNGHVVSLARLHGATLVCNSDAHAPRDLMTPAFQQSVARGAGITDEELAVHRARLDAWLATRA